MIISRNILELINSEIKQISNLQLENAMTALGLEVEGQAVKYNSKQYTNLFFGKIITYEKIPSTNKLNLCKVKLFDSLKKCFASKIHNIICGGDNLSKGVMVIVALPDQILPNGLTIKNRKIRGIVSRGMICSLDELGIINAQIHSAHGIFIIKKQTDLWIKIINGEYANPIDLFNDYLFDVTSVYNSHFLQNKVFLVNLILWMIKNQSKKRYPSQVLHVETLNKFRISCKKEKSLLQIDDILKKKAYGMLLKANVESIKQAHDKFSLAILSSLISIGFNLINKVVNYVNLFSYIFGQPMHVYDENVVTSKLIVTNATKDTNVTGLFNKSIFLTANDIIIKREDDKIVSIPSILGMDKYAFHNLQSKHAFIEILSINALNIANSAKRMNIDTPSAKLGRKYASQYFVNQAAAFFLNKKLKQKIIRKIRMSYIYLKNNLGLSDHAFINLTTYLQALGIDVVTNNSQITIVVSNKAHWIRTESDFMQFCYQLMLYMNLAPEINYDWLRIKTGNTSNKLKDLLQFFGFSETNPYLLTSPEKGKWFQFSEWNEKKSSIQVINDINPNYKQFVKSLLTPLLDIIKINRNLNEKNIKIYVNQILPTEKTSFSNRLAIIHASEDSFSYQKYRQIYTLLLKILKLYSISMSDIQMRRIRETKDVFIHEFVNPFNSYLIDLKDKVIGIFGEISPFLLAKNKINVNSVYYIELALDEIKANNHAKEVFQRQSKHPKIIKDLTFLFSKETSFIKVNNLISSFDFIDEVWIDKVFLSKEGLSVSFKFIIFQDHTLSSLELRNILKKIISKVKTMHKDVLLKGNI